VFNPSDWKYPDQIINKSIEDLKEMLNKVKDISKALNQLSVETED
jgi:hypothetical protein